MFQWLAQLVHVMFYCLLRQRSFSSCNEYRTNNTTGSVDDVTSVSDKTTIMWPSIYPVLTQRGSSPSAHRSEKLSQFLCHWNIKWEWRRAWHHSRSRHWSEIWNIWCYNTHKMSSCSWMMLAWGLSLFIACTSRRLLACSRLEDERKSHILWIHFQPTQNFRKRKN